LSWRHWSWWLQKQQQIAIADNNDYLGVNPGGDLEQLGCWLTPACQAWQAAKSLHHFVVYPMVDALSVKQENGLDVPPYGHWRAEFYTYTYASLD